MNNSTTCDWCKKIYVETEDYQFIADYAIVVCIQCIEDTQPPYNYNLDN